MGEQALRRAMETYGDLVYRLALCRMQNIADAEDVYQDVFLALLRQPAERWDSRHLRAWLIRVTLNRCVDLHRFRLRRPVLSLEELPEAADREREGYGALWAAVGQLPPLLRTVVHLHYGEGLTTEEIAAAVGCAPATVRTRLHRARARLRELLGGMEDV